MGFLVEHCSELESSLLHPQNFEHSPSGQWLAERYREIVPVILPDVLHCLDTGEPLAPRSVAAVRTSAEGILAGRVPLHTVLHGGIPALRVFAAFLQPHHSRLTSAELASILGRASVVATELGACWAHAWSSAPSRAASHTGSAAVSAAGSSEPAADVPAGADTEVHVPDLIAVPGHLDDADLDMVLLAAQGRSNEEIAQATAYSPHAVKWHLGRAMRTWNVRNRASLITTALLRGALRPRTRLMPPAAIQPPVPQDPGQS